MYAVDATDFLEHHGVKGMKWGVRRYRNEDGSLTAAGKRRYLQGNPDTSYKDLGYDRKTSEQIVNRMIKKNRTLGFV